MTEVNFLVYWKIHLQIINLKNGIDFAYVGASALDTNYLNSLGIVTITNSSLQDELSWYLSVKAEVESSKDKFIPGKPTLFHNFLTLCIFLPYPK